MAKPSQILSPGPNTPLGYQALLVSLTKTTKTISHECFLEPSHVGGRLPISRVTRALASLRRWHSNIPSHFHWKSSLPHQHRRAVCLLHLRFQATVTTLTRPFLLFITARSTDAMIPAKRALYEQMSNSCIEASEVAVSILRRMREDQTLSSLILFDSHFIGEVIGILIMALQNLGGTERQAMVQFCLETFRSMEKVGWCERLSSEVETTVQESGILETSLIQPAQPLAPLEPFDSRVVGTVPQMASETDMSGFSEYTEL